MKFVIDAHVECVICNELKTLKSFPPIADGRLPSRTCYECADGQMTHWERTCRNLPFYVTDDQKWEYIAIEFMEQIDENNLSYAARVNFEKWIGGFHDSSHFLHFQVFLLNDGWEFYESSILGPDYSGEYCIFRRPRSQ